MNPRAPLGYDLDMIPVPQEDARPWGTRMWDFLKGGGPWGTAQPGQRGTWVPSQINAQGQPELAVPGIVQQPAESLYGLMTAPLSDIVRSGNRDAMRAAAEASFDVAGALPAAGAAVTKAAPKSRAMVAAANAPDDPNTASLLAALASMDNPGKMSGEEILKAGTRRPANLNEPGLAQLEPGPRDTASFRGYQQGEVQPLYEYDPSKWRQGDVDPPPLSAVARMPIDKYDVWDAAQKPLATLRDRYGVRVSRDRHEPEPQQLAAALGRVEEVVRRTMQEGPPDRMMYPRMYVSIHNRTDGNVATVKAKTSSGIPELMVSANASADAIENALRGYFNPKPGRLMSNPDGPTTAAILAILAAQQGGQQQ